MDPKWLKWGLRLQAVAQNGLSYAHGPYDIERYELIRSIATEMMSEQAHADPEIVRDIYTLETGYATPKIDVRGAIFADSSILLVKEKADGCWTLPGGWAEIGESPSEAVEREVFEESGLRSWHRGFWPYMIGGSTRIRQRLITSTSSFSNVK